MRFQQAVDVASRGELGRGLVSSLLSGHTGILRIHDALPGAEIEALKQAVAQHQMDYYLDPIVGKIGPSHFEYRDNPEEYFRLTRSSWEMRPVLAATSLSLLAKVGRILELVGLHPVQAASHRKGETLNTIVFRDIRHGVPLHVDWHAVDIPAWLDDAVHAQLSWCLYLDVPPIGGQLRVFPAQWKPQAEAFRIPHSFEFSTAVLPMQAEPACVQPQVGDFVLFNSKNFHDVAPSDPARPRLSASSFVGVAGHRGFLWA